MDDIGFGEHIAAFVLTIFDLSLLISGLFFMYRGVRKSYILPLSILANIISSNYFGTHGVGNFIDTINFELWPFINLVLLIIFSVNYKANKEKNNHLKKERSPWIKWMFGVAITIFFIWLILVLWFFAKIIFIILG